MRVSIVKRSLVRNSTPVGEGLLVAAANDAPFSNNSAFATIVVFTLLSPSVKRPVTYTGPESSVSNPTKFELVAAVAPATEMAALSDSSVSFLSLFVASKTLASFQTKTSVVVELTSIEAGRPLVSAPIAKTLVGETAVMFVAFSVLANNFESKVALTSAIASAVVPLRTSVTIEGVTPRTTAIKA